MKKRLISVLLSVLSVLQIFLFCIPNVTALTSQQVEANKQTIFNYLTQEMNYNTAAACGVLANIEKESYFDPNTTGDGGTSYGICQWHNTRWDDLKDYCNSKGYDWKTLDGQLRFLEHELTKSGSLYKNTVHGKLLSVENTPDGAYEAAYAWCYYFEIPADREATAKSRGNLAKTTYWPAFYVPPVEEPKPKDELNIVVADAIIRMGDTYMITPEITSTAGVKSITFKPADEKIVTVDANGNVTTVEVGTTEVVCTVTDNNGNEATAICEVTVTVNLLEKIIMILTQIWDLICSILNI